MDSMSNVLNSMSVMDILVMASHGIKFNVNDGKLADVKDEE